MWKYLLNFTLEYEWPGLARNSRKARFTGFPKYHCLTILIASLHAVVVSGADLPLSYVKDQCNTESPKVVIIREAADWKVINKSDKNIFCVKPGDYRAAGVIKITTSGTNDSPHYLVYSDLKSNDTVSIKHPANKMKSRRAIVSGIAFLAAENWVISGLTLKPKTVKSGQIVSFPRGMGSSAIVLDRLLIEGGGGGAGQLYLGEDTENIVLQNSVLRNTVILPQRDSHCIKIDGSKNISIIDNEIYNCAGDGIQLSQKGASGARIIGNDIYITDDMYSNCLGTLQKSGLCACAENAIDIKGATSAPDPAPPVEWVTIRSNRLWGFRHTDTLCGGTGDAGNAVVIHWDPSDYILIEFNTIRSSDRGLNVADHSRGIYSDGTDHVSIRANLFYDIQSDGERLAKALVLGKAEEYEVYGNIIVNADIYLVMGKRPGQKNKFKCNLMINAGVAAGAWGKKSEITLNTYFNTKPIGGDQEADFQIISESGSGEEMLCYQDKQITSPRRLCVQGINSEALGRAASLCDGKSIGRAKGIGVDDLLYKPSLKQLPSKIMGLNQ